MVIARRPTGRAAGPAAAGSTGCVAPGPAPGGYRDADQPGARQSGDLAGQYPPGRADGDGRGGQRTPGYLAGADKPAAVAGPVAGLAPAPERAKTGYIRGPGPHPAARLAVLGGPESAGADPAA